MFRSYDLKNCEPQPAWKIVVKLLVLSGVTGALAIFTAERLFADVIAVRATNQNNSQQAQRDNMARCAGYALNGKPDGVCAGNGESNGCVGSVRAFQNSGKKSKCFIPLKFFCALFGHKQNSQPAWVSVGAAHLQNATKCVNLAQLSQVKNEQMVGIGDNAEAKGTYSIGVNDDGSSVTAGLNGNFQDGASAFGLSEGDLFKGSLEGKSLADMIADSPFGKNLSPEDLQKFKDAANNPTFDPEGTDPDYDLTGSTNPLQEAGGNLAALLNSGEGASLNDIFEKKGAEEDLIGKLLGNDGSDPFGKSRGPASADAVDKDKAKSPFDRTIFDMVSAQYRKNAPNLVDISVFMRKAAREKRARDVKDSARTPTAAASQIKL